MRLKNIKRLLALILIGIFIFSCSEDEKLDLNVSNIQSENFVSLKKVNEIGSSIIFLNASIENRQKKTSKSVENITEVCDENGEVVYYVINYKKGGFIILSADNRLDPIMAFSETNTFFVTSNGYPAGIAQWLSENKEIVKKIRKSKTTQSAEIKKRWDELDGKTAPPPDDEYPPPGGGDGGEGSCENVHTSVLPLLNTSWYQQFPFNDSINYPVCSDGTKVPAGCVAVAMAQVMNYYKFPLSYDWTSTSSSYHLIGTLEIHKLMADIGEAVIMNYDCDNPSTTTLSKAYTAFINTFGYPYVQHLNFNISKVQSELLLGRPVILRGDGGGEIGHAWVCDGFTKSVYCNGTTYSMYHMNWGWDIFTNNYNGYYGIGYWNTANGAFNNNRAMLVYITP